MLLNCQSLYTTYFILCKRFRSRTPTFRKTVTVPTPRTPTPFKNALAAQEKMHGPLKMEVRDHYHSLCALFVTINLTTSWFQPQPLAFLEEDIREVLKKETGADIFSRADQPEYRLWKQNVRALYRLQALRSKGESRPHMCFEFQIDGPARKVRKSLVLDPWGKDCLNIQIFQEQLNNAQVSHDVIQPLTNQQLWK